MRKESVKSRVVISRAIRMTDEHSASIKHFVTKPKVSLVGGMNPRLG
jgi:hypothetical protein